MIFHQNCLTLYFLRKLGKMSQTVSSAAVVIGALRVMVLNKKIFNNVLKACKITNGPLGSCRFPILPFYDMAI